MLVWYKLMLSSCVPLSVLLSVCLSQFRVLQRWLNPHKQRHTIAQWLVLWCQKSRQNASEITPTGALNKGGVSSNRRLSTNISLNLRNDARWGHSYYGKLIKTRMRSIERRYFQWPWVTLTALNDTNFDIHMFLMGRDREFKIGR